MAKIPKRAWLNPQTPYFSYFIRAWGKYTKQDWYDSWAHLDDVVALILQYISGGTISVGGDLSGTLPNPTVTGLNGFPIDPTAPTNGQVLIFNGTEYVPGAPTVVVPDASETVKGILELATQSETNNRTINPIDDSRAVTPRKLSDYTGWVHTGDAYISLNGNTSYPTGGAGDFNRPLLPATDLGISSVDTIYHLSPGVYTKNITLNSALGAFTRMVYEGSDKLNTIITGAVTLTKGVNNLSVSFRNLTFNATALNAVLLNITSTTSGLDVRFENCDFICGTDAATVTCSINLVGSSNVVFDSCTWIDYSGSTLNMFSITNAYNGLVDGVMFVNCGRIPAIDKIGEGYLSIYDSKTVDEVNHQAGFLNLVSTQVLGVFGSFADALPNDPLLFIKNVVFANANMEFQQVNKTGNCRWTLFGCGNVFDGNELSINPGNDINYGTPRFDTIRVFNNSGGTILKGTNVYFSAYNSTNQVPEITPVSGVSLPIFGIALSDIEDGKCGTILSQGLITNALDTSTAAVGDAVYADAVTGAISLVVSGNVVGYVITVSVNGNIWYKV